MRITPYYEQKGIKNPFYILSPPVVSGAVRELKKRGDEYKNIKGTDILFKCVEPNQWKGPLIYKLQVLLVKFFK